MTDHFLSAWGQRSLLSSPMSTRGIPNCAYLQFSFSGDQVERFKGNGYEMFTKKKKKEGFLYFFKTIMPKEARAPPNPLCILPHDPGCHLLPTWGSRPLHHRDSSALTRPGHCFSFQPFSTKSWTHIPWEAAGGGPRATSGRAVRMLITVQPELRNGLSQIKFLLQSLPLLIGESGLFMRHGLDGRPCCAPAVLRSMTSRQCELGGSP